MQSSLYVFPCRDKKPLTANGLYAAQPEDHWTGEEGPQWGAPCGEKNGFWVIDVDQKSGGLEEAAKHQWGDTLRIDTPGGGYHLFYEYDSKSCSDIRNGVAVLPGIDVRSNGGYVILYGTVDRSKTLPAPPWLLELLKKKEVKKLDGLALHGEVGEGGRNHFLTAAAGRMQRIGVLSMAALNELNELKCSPPLPDSEVNTIYQSVSRYAPESVPEEEEVPAPKIIWAHEFTSSIVEYLSNKSLVMGEPTLLEEFDKLLGGGKRLGELTVTLAEAKTGKNTFWHWLMLPWLKKGLPIGYASRELSPEIEVLPNLLTLALNKNVYTDENLSAEEVMNVLKDWKLAFAPGYGTMFDEELWTWMDACREAGVQYFFIDHLHYMLANPEDYQGISIFIKNLKAYARKNNVHIDLIVQPKIQEMGTRLSLNSLRGGASIGQALDNLVTMTRERDNTGKLINVVKICLEVARSKLASLGEFFLQYDKQSMTFSVVVVTTAETPPPQEEIPPNGYETPTQPAYSTRWGVNPPENKLVFNAEKAAMSMLNRIKLPKRLD